MTINVVAKTYDAVVLGCDSLSSVVERAYFPFRHDAQFAVDGDGNRMVDADGNYLIAYRPEQLEYATTSVMGGVRKMFVLWDDGEAANCSVAAVTSGMATLNGVTIAQLAHKFQRDQRRIGATYSTLLEVVTGFRDYIRALWELELVDVQEELRKHSRLNFLVAGYCPEDEFTKVFRVDIAENTITENFPHPLQCGAAWAGQSNFAARLLMGIDSGLKLQITRAIAEALNEQRQSIVASLVDALRDAGIAIPDGFQVTVKETLSPALPFSAAEATVDWGNLPVQSAVELVSALVNAESGMQKFARGIPMVGGRTRIGLLRRNVPFVMLNEPSLSHTHIGYATDA